MKSGLAHSASADRQYVWGLRYIDDLVLRDRDTTGGGMLDERLYALQDANWNVVALADNSGGIVERSTYTAYGQPTFCNGSFANASTTSSVGSTVLYTGRDLDPETGLYFYRARYCSAQLGRFISRDPIGIVGGMNPYEYVSDGPLSSNDPQGLEKLTVAGCLQELCR